MVWWSLWKALFIQNIVFAKYLIIHNFSKRQRENRANKRAKEKWNKKDEPSYLLCSHNRLVNEKSQELVCKWEPQDGPLPFIYCFSFIGAHSMVAQASWAVILFISYLNFLHACFFFFHSSPFLPSFHCFSSFFFFFFLFFSHNFVNAFGRWLSFLSRPLEESICAQLQPQLNPLNVNEHSLCVFTVYSSMNIWAERHVFTEWCTLNKILVIVKKRAGA